MGVIAGARIVGERYVRSQRRQNPDGRMLLLTLRPVRRPCRPRTVPPRAAPFL